MPSRGRGRGAGRGGANDSANTLTLPFAAVVAGSPSPSPSPSPTPSFASPSTAPLPQTSSSAASLVAATLPQPSGSSSSGIGGGVPPLQPLPPLAPLPVPAAGAGGGVTLTADLSSPSRSMSGVGRGAIVSSGSIGAAPDQTKKGGGRGGRGRGGTVGARAQKTGRVTAAALREMEKEKEEAERQRLLDAFDEGGRLDPIPNGVRIEAKWLDDQFHDAVVIKSRQVKGANAGWLYYVHYPEFNKRMDNWVRRDQVQLPQLLSYHGSAFAVTYPAAMPVHLIPTQLKEVGVAGGAASSAAAMALTPASVTVGAAPTSAASSSAGSAPAPMDTSSGSGSGSGAGSGGAGASVSFAASNSVVTIPAASASSSSVMAGGDSSAAPSLSASESMMDIPSGSGKNQPPASASGSSETSGKGKSGGAGKSGGGINGKGGKGGKGKGKNIEDFGGRKRKRSTGRNIHDGDKKINVIKNINTIVLGKYEMDVWYYAPFPQEFKDYDKLYFCEFCLKFYAWDSELERHLNKCKLRHPPGNEIYRSEEKNVTIAVFEIDGRKEVIYCQNLCYIAKLFLDDKLYDPEDETYAFDVDPFLFYVLCEVDARGCHFVGYFSKAKLSEKNFNLACILTLPCHQRKGYGKFLISLSYELSKIEEKSGSPEKPLSDLGLVSYRSYWSQVLIDILKETKGDVSIEQLSVKTSITTEDIIDTLKWMKVIRIDSNAGEHVYNLQAEAALKVLAGVDPTKPAKRSTAAPPASSATATAAASSSSASASSGSGGGGSGSSGELRIEVRPCIADKLRWTPFILDPKKAKTSHA